MSRRLLSLTLGDPVILVLTALASGILVYSVVSTTHISLGYAFRTLHEERVIVGFSDGALKSIFDRKILRDITGGYGLLGLVTAIAGAYIAGFSRDTGYISVANLLGVDRRLYLRAQILYPSTLYTAITSTTAPITIIALLDPNLLRYWKLILATTLLVATVVTLTLTTAIILTYTLQNTYRGLIATTATVILATTIGLNRTLAEIVTRETMNQTLVALTATTTIAITAFTITYKIIETRMPTR